MVTVCWAIYGHKHRERLQKPKANGAACSSHQQKKYKKNKQKTVGDKKQKVLLN